MSPLSPNESKSEWEKMIAFKNIGATVPSSHYSHLKCANSGQESIDNGDLIDIVYLLLTAIFMWLPFQKVKYGQKIDKCDRDRSANRYCSLV